MKRLVFASALLLLSAACAGGSSGPPPRGPGAPAGPGASKSASSRRRPPFPPAARRPVVREYFGTKVIDEYAWLEDDQDPEVQAFTAAQSAFARAHLDALADRPKIVARVAALTKTLSPDWRNIQVEGDLIFALEDDGERQQAALTVLPVEGDPKSARRIVDPLAIDPSGKTTIDFFVPSPDKKLVAVSLSRDGTESGDVHVFDVANGKERSDVVTRVHGGTAGGSLAWNASSTGFWHTRYPHPDERPEPDLAFHQEVWFHELGKPASADTYAFGKELPRIAEIELARSDDGRTILATVENGDGGQIEHHVLVGSAWTRLSRFDDELGRATFAPDGKIYAVSHRDALRGKVVCFAPPFGRPPTLVLPEGEGVIEEIVVTKAALYVVEIAGGPSRVRRVPLAAKAEPLAREPRPRPKGPRPKKKNAPKPRPPEPPVTIAPGERGLVAAEVPLPTVSSVSSAVRVGEDLLLRVESFTEAPAWLRYRASEHRIVTTGLAKKLSFDTSDIEVVRETCASKDGTRVPMSILRRRGAPVDGRAPALVTGYGGFGAIRKPRLRSWYRAWLDQGGIIVETNLRGGGELGEAWHRAGMLEHKQNVFDDFAACAEAVVALGHTPPERLAAWGRSNGGLLIGSVVTQHPSLFRAVVSEVGIYDMLRSELTPNGQFNVTEYGTVRDEALFRVLFSYSPFHHVEDGAAYPAVLLTTGANDPRVDPFHSRKMAARLQAATSSERPILLRTSLATGHGSGTPRDVEIEETADRLAFLLSELGVRFR